MENFSKYLSLILAAGFCGSAAFLFGKLLGLGRLDLLWYVTFSDIVNYAPATLLLLGFLISVLLINDRRLAKLQKRALIPGEFPWLTRRIVFAVLGALAVGLVLIVVFSWRIAIGILPFGILQVYLTTMARDPLTKAFGEFVADAFDTFVAFVFVTFVMGFSWGYAGDQVTPTYTVQVDDRIEIGSVLMPMERGLVILRNGGFELVSWSQVKSVSLIPASRTSKTPVGKPAVQKARKPNSAAPPKPG
jgi:hypothetical protein